MKKIPIPKISRRFRVVDRVIESSATGAMLFTLVKWHFSPQESSLVLGLFLIPVISSGLFLYLLFTFVPSLQPFETVKWPLWFSVPFIHLLMTATVSVFLAAPLHPLVERFPEQRVFDFWLTPWVLVSAFLVEFCCIVVGSFLPFFSWKLSKKNPKTDGEEID